MGRIFAEAARIVQKYSGTVERFFGDEMVAVFGTPTPHDDDAVRAVQAAREIHDTVGGIGNHLQQRTGDDVAIKTGIHTGLVDSEGHPRDPLVNGQIKDAVNLAEQLQGIAQPGDILVGQETYQQTVGLFSFEFLESCHVTGKINPIPVYKFLAQKEKPPNAHTASRIRADFVGRQSELDRLLAAAADLRQGKGGVISICGNAGTGKSRLVAEFKAALNLDVIHWCEGYAYAYARNIHYFPMLRVLRRLIRKSGNPGFWRPFEHSAKRSHGSSRPSSAWKIFNGRIHRRWNSFRPCCRNLIIRPCFWWPIDRLLPQSAGN